MDPITLLIVIVVGAFAAGMIFSKNFRDRVLQTLRIKSNSALDNATTALEREKDEYDQLVAKLPAQRAAVQKVMGNARIAQKDLDAKVADVARLEREYKEAKSLGASDAALDELATKYSEAEAAVEEQKKIVTEANAAADEARNALDATTKALGKFAARIEADGRKVELTEALKVSAEARQQAKDIASSLSKAGEASRQIDKELEEARAANELAKGTATEQELEQLREKAAAKSAREKLEGKLGGTAQ
jgi:translation initiation factor IF-2